MVNNTNSASGDAQAASVIRPEARIADAIRKAAAAQNVAVEAVLEELGAIHATAPKPSTGKLFIQADDDSLTFPDPEAYDTETTGDDLYFVHKLASHLPHGTVLASPDGKLVCAVPPKGDMPVRLEPYTQSDYMTLADKYIYAYRPIPLKRVKGEAVVDDDGNPVPVRPYRNKLEKKYGKRLVLPAPWLEAELNRRDFINAMPVVKQLMPYPCCVPVWRNGEHGKLLDIRRIGVGYDRESQLLVASSNAPEVPPMTFEQAREFVWDSLKDFSFDGEPGDKSAPSAGAAVTAMIGALCHECFDYWPMAIATANAPGSGKTLLLSTIFSPFFGHVSSKTLSVNPSADVDRAALLGFPLAWFDEQRNVVASALLDYSTKKMADFRNLGTTTGGKVTPWRTQFAISGNMVNARPDVVRRTLSLNLQYKERTADDFNKELDTLVEDETWRAQMREAIYTIARAFIDSGAYADKTQYVLSNANTTFAPYYRFCARAAMFAGFGDATAKRNLATFGDNDSSVLRSIFDCAAHYIACLPESATAELDVHHLFGNRNFDSVHSIGKEVRFSTLKLKQTLEYNGLVDCFGGDKAGLMQRLGTRLGKFHGGIQGKYSSETYTTELGVSYKLGYSRNCEGSGMLIKVTAVPAPTAHKA